MKNNVDLLFVGGHHTSAVPLIEIFKKQGKVIHFIGHKYASNTNKEVSSEYKEIRNLNIPYTNLDSPKFYNVSGFVKYLRLIKSIFFCFILLIKNRPKVVFTFGGYLSVPVAIASKILLIKVVTHEQTVTGGLASKVCNYLSDVVFLTFENPSFSGKKFFVVGLPLREEVKGIKPRVLDSSYVIKTLFIQGGKQGSHVLNNFVFNNLTILTKEYIVYHQTSIHSEYDDFKRSREYMKTYSGKYYSFDFLYGKDYQKVLKNADLLLSRSGAHMVYEACYLKIPSIFIPIPWASNNEQLKNAQNASNYIPCSIINQDKLSMVRFNKSIKSIREGIKNVSLLKSVPTDAENKIVRHINKVYL